MKIFNHELILALPITLMVMACAHANPNNMVGKKLSDADLSKLENHQQVQLADQSFKIISEHKAPINASTKSTTNAPSTRTYVADANGLVGVAQNAVIISNTPITQVKSKANQLINTAISSKYYDHLNITSLQFRSLNEAVEAQRKLVKLFPNAKVSIPIQFSESKVR